MAPRTRAADAKEASKQDKPHNQHHTVDSEDNMSIDSDVNTRKRKAPPTNTKSSQPDQKSQKTKKSSSTPTTRQLLNFLLSSSSLSLCYPSDDLNANKSNPSIKKTYSTTPPSSFTPFETLLIAHLLSKPLSHTLGLRSIRTLLNPPYSLTTPQSIKSAGESRVLEALEEAKTQHRQKTAKYIHDMAVSYCDSETMYNLAVEANEDGPLGVTKHIKDTVPGLAETGAALFCRRIQAIDGWGDAIWPYADAKSLDSLRTLGISVDDADELQTLIEREVDWSTVGQMGLDKLVGTGRETGDDKDGVVADMDMEQRIAVELVVLLERAVGAVLQGNVEEVKRRAAE